MSLFGSPRQRPKSIKLVMCATTNYMCMYIRVWRQLIDMCACVWAHFRQVSTKLAWTRRHCRGRGIRHRRRRRPYAHRRRCRHHRRRRGCKTTRAMNPWAPRVPRPDWEIPCRHPERYCIDDDSCFILCHLS